MYIHLRDWVGGMFKKGKPSRGTLLSRRQVTYLDLTSTGLETTASEYFIILVFLSYHHTCSLSVALHHHFFEHSPQCLSFYYHINSSAQLPSKGTTKTGMHMHRRSSSRPVYVQADIVAACQIRGLSMYSRERILRDPRFSHTRLSKIR